MDYKKLIGVPVIRLDGKTGFLNEYTDGVWSEGKFEPCEKFRILLSDGEEEEFPFDPFVFLEAYRFSEKSLQDTVYSEIAEKKNIRKALLEKALSGMENEPPFFITKETERGIEKLLYRLNCRTEEEALKVFEFAVNDEWKDFYRTSRWHIVRLYNRKTKKCIAREG